jgi:hypothetical protein
VKELGAPKPGTGGGVGLAPYPGAPVVTPGTEPVGWGKPGCDTVDDVGIGWPGSGVD